MLKKYDRPYDGQNLVEMLGNQNTDRYLAFRIDDQAALIGHRYKIYSNDNGENFSLYDLRADPGEEKDISREEEKLFSNLVGEWEKWKISQERSATGADY